jgi:uncharacterized protein (DUF934 family)
MPLLKNGQVVDDSWQAVAAGEPLPAEGPVLVPYERWQAERDTLIGRNTPLGVRLANTHPVEALALDIDRLDLIVLEFPKFIDGRAFTQARLLRERYGYRGELRATGNVLRDELLFMQRCGFDAFETTDPKAVESWRAALSEFSVFYQPAADTQTPVSKLRQRLVAKITA